jgi:hypothetical protein
MIEAQHFVTAAAIAAPLWMMTTPAGARDVIETMREVSSSGQFEIDAFATAFEAAGLAGTLEDGLAYDLRADRRGVPDAPARRPGTSGTGEDTGRTAAIGGLGSALGSAEALHRRR